MRVIEAYDINTALDLGITAIKQSGIQRNSRNGPVLEFPTPVTTAYRSPTRRVLFNETRNHNSVFAWAETLWMFAGRDDLDFLIPFNKNMVKYSDDGKLIRGSAYGRRWRSWFGHDQLQKAIDSLRVDKDTRRVVIQQWDAHTDNEIQSKDVPCNTVIYLRCMPSETHESGYVLDLTVSCRSNDMIYGAYGSNVVHFSILLEVVAAAIGVGIGTYYQVSNSLHVYTEIDVAKKLLAEPIDFAETPSYYTLGLKPFPIIGAGETYEMFMEDVTTFFKLIDEEDYRDGVYQTVWFNKVWLPIMNSFVTWSLYENKPDRLVQALEELKDCVAEDLKYDISRRYSRLFKASQEKAAARQEA